MSFPKTLRSDFPIFEKKCWNNELCYLDNAATTHKPNAVIEAVSEFYRFQNASVHRGIYSQAESATAQFEAVRTIVSSFIGSDSNEIVFTSGATEGINFVADAWGFHNIKAGDHIVVSEAEHHANLLPWLRLAERKNAKIIFIPINKDTDQLDFDESIITCRTKLVAVTHCSNVLGNVWKHGDLDLLVKKARAVGAKILLDGAQSVAHQKIDVKTLDIDFFVFSAHKIMGPTGLGFLFIKSNVQDDVQPYQVGGVMVHSALPGSLKWRTGPQKFEAGTQPVAQVIGFGAAINYINEKINFCKLSSHENSLCEKIISFLKSVPGVKVLGPKSDSKHIVSFAVAVVHAHDLADFLGECGVAVRAGHHCAQLLHNCLGVEATVRASVFCYNTAQDIDCFINAFNKARSIFGL